VVEPLLEAGRRFFASEDVIKRRVPMSQDESVRHGYWPLAKAARANCNRNETLYFYAPLALESGSVSQRPTLLPRLPGFREPVMDYMRSLTGLGHKLMSMIARGLLLEDSYFVDRYTGSPATSFRIDNYPQLSAIETPFETRGGSARADQGLLTLLKQGGMGGGLELKLEGRWIAAADIPNSFVCTAGETLAQLTSGRYLSTSHRVRNNVHGARLVMPFCFDPNREAVIERIAALPLGTERVDDRQSTTEPEHAHRLLA
jgi:isopenicillin N synthase-like dioxygenase